MSEATAATSVAAEDKGKGPEVVTAATPVSPDAPVTKMRLRASKECAVDTVTVYGDRAEVLRNVEVDITAPGPVEVAIEGLSIHVDPNSVHVSGGKGHAVILECVTKAAFDESAEDVASAVKRKRDEVEAMEDQLKEMDIKLAAIRRSSAWLDGLAESVKTSPIKQAGKDSEYIEKISHFSEFYTKQSLDQALAANAMEKQMKELKNKIDTFRREIREQSAQGNRKESKTVLITLQATAAGKAVFQLAYVLSNASWKAAYDCRVDGQQGTIQLSYYGCITNGTEEDWNDSRLLLSTASPSIGGEPPLLPMATVSFNAPYVPVSRAKHSMRRKASMEFDERLCCQTMAVDTLGGDARGLEEELPAMQVLTTKAAEAMASSTFEIPRRSTVLADNQEHRVTIAVISNLAAKLTYSIVPRMSEYAFLKASTTNTSEWPLLAGDCNVFIDSNFVATSSLKYTATGEEFAFFLGSDQSVKVTYKPVTSVRDETGLIRKSSVEKYTGSITVKNAKAKDVSVVVYEQLPKSDTEQIKVTLIEPDPKTCTINPKNNVEIRAPVAAGQTTVFQIRYTVESPKDKPVFFSWGL